MTSFLLTQVKFQGDLSMKTLNPLFRGVLTPQADLSAAFMKACKDGAEVRVTFGALSEELATEAERILSDVGVVRRQTEDEHAGFIAKNDAFKKKKLLQLDSLAKNKDVIDLSRELLAMHGQGGKSSKRRRFAERLARLSEKSERIGSYGLKEAKEEEKNSSEEEEEEN